MEQSKTSAGLILNVDGKGRVQPQPLDTRGELFVINQEVLGIQGSAVVHIFLRFSVSQWVLRQGDPVPPTTYL